MKPDFDLALYLVTDPRLGGDRSVAGIVREAVAGGVTMVQLRDPDASTRALIETGRALAEALAGKNVPLIVNDRVDVALAIGAAGVHLGASDMDAAIARRLLGPERIIGLSVGTPAEFAHEREHLDCVDYLGVGPVYATGTKADAGAAIGPEGLAAVASTTKLPIVAIGGIDADNAAACIRAGADGVAVVSAIIAAADPRRAAERLHAAAKQGNCV